MGKLFHRRTRSCAAQRTIYAGAFARTGTSFGAHSRWRAGLLMAAWLLNGCGRAIEEPAPDMDLVRGDPIEVAGDRADESGTLDSPEESAVLTELDAEWETTEDGLVVVSFDRLAGFEYEPGDGEVPDGSPESSSQIPEAIRELSGREVAVRGFMLPIKVEGGLVREFLLMRDQSMCCFGVVPRINEWVAVTMTGRGVRAMMDQPVTVFGTLRVGEIYEHGVLGGIYRMEAEELAGALDL